LIAVVGNGLAKASILYWYRQAFTSRVLRLSALCMLAVTAVWTTALFLAHLLTCRPVSPFLESIYGNKCFDAYPLWLSAAATDLILNFAILLMPLPSVLKMKLRMTSTLIVVGIFAAGSV
jgi:hypothetical protein